MQFGCLIVAVVLSSSAADRRRPKSSRSRPYEGPVSCETAAVAKEALPGCTLDDGIQSFCLHGRSFSVVNGSLGDVQYMQTREGLLLAHLLQSLGKSEGKGKVFMDVGTKRGVFASAAAASFPDLNVVAVEPQPECVRFAKCTVAANNVGDRVEVVNAYARSSEGAQHIPTQSVLCDPPDSIGGV
eukprot:Hpha_TRINITY_DN9421_c0_g1::TRINITY_DN9421_c0_g1_i2::g.139093::m.139093